MSVIIETQLQIAGARLPADLIERVREAMQREPWGLWCTLYVDSSNAGATPGTSNAATAKQWAWGARGRATDSIVQLRPLHSESSDHPIEGGEA